MFLPDVEERLAPFLFSVSDFSSFFFFWGPPPPTPPRTDFFFLLLDRGRFLFFHPPQPPCEGHLDSLFSHGTCFNEFPRRLYDFSLPNFPSFLSVPPLTAVSLLGSVASLPPYAIARARCVSWARVFFMAQCLFPVLTAHSASTSPVEMADFFSSV